MTKDELKTYYLSLEHEVTPEGVVLLESVYLRKKRLKSLDCGLVVVAVRGDFNCSVNKIGSLSGAPLTVTGQFDCSENRLEALHGCPVGASSYDLSSNKLRTLRGIPREVYGSIKLSRNLFRDLNGFPDMVAGKVELRHNRGRVDLTVTEPVTMPLQSEEFSTDFQENTLANGASFGMSMTDTVGCVEWLVASWKKTLKADPGRVWEVPKGLLPMVNESADAAIASGMMD